jgi:hypothetical protein
MSPASEDQPPNGASAAPIIDPMAFLLEEADSHLRLCALLEAIADSLPDAAFSEAEAAMPLLRVGLSRHAALLERCLFPLLRRRLRGDEVAHMLLSQLEAEHATDHNLTIDIAESVGALIETRRVANPNMLGYQLRCFFEGYRRHRVWEQYLLRALAPHLIAEDIMILRRSILEIDHPSISEFGGG